MVETQVDNSNVDQDQQQEQTSQMARLPAAILSLIAFYLPDIGKGRLSQGSLRFEKAMQSHFRLLLTREFKSDKSIAEHMADMEATDQLEKLTNKPSGLLGKIQPKEETSWRVKYAQKHSRQCFSIANEILKLDPFDESSCPV